jgi:hypothetical protein
MALLDDIRSHLAVANEDQRKRRGAVLLREAAAEIERLRSQPCPYVTGTVTRYCTLTPFTLTDEEREAIANGASSLESEAMREGTSLGATAYMRQHAASLRSLLTRLG